MAPSSPIATVGAEEGAATSWDASWRGVCENGSVTWDGGGIVRGQIGQKRKKPALVSGVREFEVRVPAKKSGEGHEAVIREFVDCVRTGEPPRTICSDNIKSLAMVMAAVKSARTKKRVAVADG